MAFFHHPALEAAILADPEDADSYLVYSDWLQSAGDPRGELIAVAHQLARADAGGDPTPDPRPAPDHRTLLRRRERLRTEVIAGLVRPLALHYAVRLRWHLGFVTGATVDVTECYRHELWPPAVVERLLAHPACRLLRALTVDGVYGDRRGRAPGAGDSPTELVAGLLAALRRAAWPPCLARLGLHGSRSGRGVLASAEQLAALAELPATSLALTASELPEAGILALDPGRVQDLELRVHRWHLADWQVLLGEREWPVLGRLVVSAADDGLELPRRLTDASGYPALRHLGLMDAPHSDRLLAAVTRSPLLARLHSLDATFARTSPGACDDLVARAGALRHVALFPTGGLAFDGYRPGDEEEHRRFVELCQRMGTLARAAAVYDRAIADDPHRAMAWLARAWIHDRVGQPDRARACREQMAAIEPGYGRAHAHVHGPVTNT